MKNKAMHTGKELGAAIRAAIKLKGVSQTSVARHFGVSAPSVQDWLNRGSIAKDKLPELWTYFSDVVGAAHWGLPDFPREPGESRTRQALTADDGAHADIVIAQYDAGGAMGHGFELEEKQPGLIKSWRVDHEWLRLNVRHHTGLANLCIVTGFGPSMQPKYNPGDPLLMDRGINVVETEGIYFFRVANHGYIKQLQRIPTEDGLIIRAKSLNTSYDPFDITKKMDFEVFGKILTVWRSEQL